MHHFKAQEFLYIPEQRKYVAEASTLRIGRPTDTIRIDDRWDFALTHIDRDRAGEDTYGWHYKPTVGSVNRNGALAGHTVLIIND